MVFGGLSVVLYRPWRRRVDAKRGRMALSASDEDGQSSELGEVEVLDDQQLVDTSTELAGSKQGGAADWRDDTGKGADVKTKVRSVEVVGESSQGSGPSS